MNTDPLNENEMTFINSVLERCDSDDAIVDVSELDGFLTAIISGPQMIMPSTWLPEIWGGPDEDPAWENDNEIEKFSGLVFQQMNNIVSALMDYPDEFEALFNIAEFEDETHTMVEEWCFGYMRGIDLAGGWPSLPPEQQKHLDAIALHGTEENFARIDSMSREDYIASKDLIEPAVRALHAYWLSRRMPANEHSFHAEPKVGRNDPCPCGSGKKYKKCCLQ